MTHRRFFTFFTLALTLIVLSFAVSAQQSRSTPKNDSFTTPKTIRIGKNYSVSNIGTATNEAGEPVASCLGDAIPHSVWYKFTQPEWSYISLSTFGSLMAVPDSQHTNTILAIFEEVSPGVFTERACHQKSLSSSSPQITFQAQPFVTFYIAVGSYNLSSSEYLPESTLKLTTRMIGTTIRPPNFSFETPVNGSDWKLKKATDDQVVCSNATYLAQQGVCAFRFTGTPGKTTMLTQTFDFPAAFLPRKNALLANTFYFRVMETASLGKAKIRYIVNYKDGTSPSVRIIKFNGMAAMGNYDGRMFIHRLKSSKIASLKFEVTFGSPTGTLLIDNVALLYNADPATRGNGLLPLPPSPAAK